MGRRVITKRIGELLIERKVIQPADLEKALAHQRKHGGILGQILVELGLAPEDEIALALTAQYGFPYLPLDNYEIDRSLTELIPEHVAKRYCLIAVDQIGNALTLAMADPTNVQAIEDVEHMTKCVVQTFVSTASDIQKAIGRFYHPDADGTGGGGQEEPNRSG